jgi:hypothetical protein
MRSSPAVKLPKSEIIAHYRKIPEIQIVDPQQSNMTSFAGLVIFQKLFSDMNICARLRSCFSDESNSPMYGFHRLALWLIIHLILGYRQIKDVKYYEHDPMVLRILNLKRMPDPSSFSRGMNAVAQSSIDKLSTLMTEIVCERLSAEKLPRVTMDFDGSVISTSRHAEGTAVGYNKKKKGQRSYYPLFCTVAQTGQFFDMLHRPGNVHDSNGADEFIDACLMKAKQCLPGVVIETRMDSAFFSENQLENLNDQKVEFSISTPYERFPELKSIISARKRWGNIDPEWSFFEIDWEPKSWANNFRFIVYRHKLKKQRKGPLQLDLFEPVSFDYEYKVVVTNKKANAKKILHFHNGRGGQEGIFGDAKNDCKIEYVPVRSLTGNQFYCLAGMMSHNLSRELQMRTYEKDRGTNEKRSPLWIFQKLSVIRQKIVQRAGKLIRPQGKLTLVMAADGPLKSEIEEFLTIAS